MATEADMDTRIEAFLVRHRAKRLAFDRNRRKSPNIWLLVGGCAFSGIILGCVIGDGLGTWLHQLVTHCG